MRDTDTARRLAIRAKYAEMQRKGLWSYNDRYDAFYETKSRKWIENKCHDRTCDYCAKRPKLAPIKRKPPQNGSAK